MRLPFFYYSKVEAAFSITDTTITSFSSFVIMKEMEKEKDENGRHSEKEMEVKRFGKENVKKKDVFFRYRLPSSSVCLETSLIGSI